EEIRMWTSAAPASRRPRDRTVPGTASAKEGYQPERGTSAGDPLEGLESEDATRSRSAPEAAEADPREGDPANGT
ncbi:hypothetical protein, partial [Streptomyces sp. NPDC003374]